MFKRVPLDEIQAYLAALDQQLASSVRLIVIGGSAVALSGLPTKATSDIDLFNNPGPEFWQAVEACRLHPKAVPVSKVNVSSQPYDFEDRLLPISIPGLKHLRLFIPEAHDLAIMKLARGEPHDLDALIALHERTPFDLETLRRRYEETDFIGNRAMFRLSLLSLVEMLFGQAAAEALEAVV